jgi:hypothetical protein
MVATLFVGFVGMMAAIVVTLVARYLNARSAFAVLALMAAWLTYVGLLAYLGVFKNTAMRPPGTVFLLVPVLLFLFLFFVFVFRSSTGARVALAFPLWVLLGAESFRIGVELFLHQLWIGGLIPKMLTFDGANVDIYIGASAAVIAWLSTRGKVGMRLALAWSVLGLLALTNVVIRAVLTSPGPFNVIHAEVPNRLFGTFPFLLIPGFFVPLAVVLHLLAIRAISSQLRTGVEVGMVGTRHSQEGSPSASI